MQVKPEDIEYIESDLSGTATVVSLNDLSDEHVNEKYDLKKKSDGIRHS